VERMEHSHRSAGMSKSICPNAAIASVLSVVVRVAAEEANRVRDRSATKTGSTVTL
jgi:hypothetical protein